MEEYLVLLDGGKPALFEDNKLTARTQRVPPGILTVILDACFSGGLFKAILALDTDDIEVAQVKVWQPPQEEVVKAFALESAVSGASKPMKIARYHRFGCMPLSSPRAIVKAFSPDLTAEFKATNKALSDSSENLQPELQGLLVSACLETETASASTSRTEGMSAFTHSMRNAIIGLGNSASAAQVFKATAESLKKLGFQQTPLLLERETPGSLKSRSFINMEDQKMANVMNEFDATMMTSGTGVTEEETQKFLGALIPVVLSAAPSIINALRPRRKEISTSGGGHVASDRGDANYVH